MVADMILGDDTTRLVDLASSLLIKNISDLKCVLDECFLDDKSIVFDASSVELVDTATLQLLVAFVNSLKQKNRTTEWLNPSDIFIEMAELLDLTEALNLRAGTLKGSFEKDESSQENVNSNQEKIKELDDGLLPVF